MAAASMWNCPACGTKGLLATNHQYCPACGLEQDELARYIPSEAEKAAAAEHPYLGRELACLICHSLNSRASNNCAGCGCSLAGAREMPAPSGSRANMSRAGMSSAGTSRAGMSSAGTSRAGMSSAGTSRAGMSRPGMSRSDLSRSGMRAADSLTAEIEAERTRQSELSRKRAMQVSQSVAAAEAGKARTRMIVAFVVVLAAGTLYALRNRNPAAREAKALAHEWTRIIEIEQYRESVQNAPCDRPLPNSQSIGPRGGAGMCGYRLKAWEVVREAKNEGEGIDSERSWPEYRLRWTGEGNCDGCEREGARIELFTVRFDYGGQTQSCELDRATWTTIAVDDSFEVRPDAANGGFDCASLIPG